MALDANEDLILYQYRQDLVNALQVDGYFSGRIQSTGDGSGGMHQVRFFEPNDGSVPTRCFQIVSLYLQTAYTTGLLRVIGKLGGNDQEDIFVVPTTVQSFSSVTAAHYATGGGELSMVVRNRGWIVPSTGPGTQRLIVGAEFDNVNLTAVDFRVFGYYMLVRL